jgi:hypothetical protein
MAITTRRKTKSRGTPRKAAKKAAALEVRLVHPSNSPAVIERGRRLADQVRLELAASDHESLDETMSQLRGREWS